MTDYSLSGGCHCGNLAFTMTLSQAPGNYTPRACDCDFCRKHGAAYLSDPAGTISLSVRDNRQLGRYRQGSGAAEFLLCRGCGVLVAVCYRDNTGGDSNDYYMAVNSQAVAGDPAFGAAGTASPKSLGQDEKIQRWRTLWFQKATIRFTTS